MGWVQIQKKSKQVKQTMILVAVTGLLMSCGSSFNETGTLPNFNSGGLTPKQVQFLETAAPEPLAVPELAAVPDSDLGATDVPKEGSAAEKSRPAARPAVKPQVKKEEDADGPSEKTMPSRQCNAYLTTEVVGTWGKDIEAIVDHYSYLVDGPRDVVRLCPNFTKMSIEEKKRLYVLILGSMSYYESSCTLVEPGRGPNGALYGLLQLAAGHEGAYSAGCRNGDSRQPETTFKCALSMLDDQVRRDGVLFSSRSYWEVLRPNPASPEFRGPRARVAPAVHIEEAIRTYPDCKASAQ